MLCLPTFSIVIATNSRARSLAATLESLRYLDYPRFEVCVVYGAAPDGTRELLESWRGRVKVQHCAEHSLTAARNVGLAMASGEIVAFLDDDAIPEPEWLRDLAQAYDKPDVGGAGGTVYDHDGVSLQFRFSTIDRLGHPIVVRGERPVPELNFPLSATFPHLLGTNCSFRRDLLLALGGFDEAYLRYLEETDICCRAVDAGWRLVQVANAYIHHKQLSDELRTDRRAIRGWYTLIRSKVYFGLRNGWRHHTPDELFCHVRDFIQGLSTNLERDIEAGALADGDRERFRQEVVRGWRDGLRIAATGKRRTISARIRRHHARPFLPFPSATPPGGRKTLCFLSQSYPPGPVGGIARFVQQLARSFAALGHHVHVLTRGEHKDRIDVEEAVWVHRIVPRKTPLPAAAADAIVPRHIWDHSATMLQELERICSRRPLDCVYAPLWDCEGLAVMLDARFPLVVGLQTPLQSFLSSQPHLQRDERFMAEFARPMQALGQRLLDGATRIHANSTAIVAEIERDYGIVLRPPRLAIVPHGLDDWSGLCRRPPPSLPEGTLRLLFVGRLEARKGIDVLLAAAKRLFARYPHLHLDLVGNDTIKGPDGATYRELFESDAGNAAIRRRVRFHGELDDESLRGFYCACDIFIAPSRFESFGLVLLEAMMFGKPIVACRTGGMAEIIEDGVNGLLAEPGDAASLEARLVRLIETASLRDRLGAAARRRYEERFTADRMTQALANFLTSAAAEPGSAATRSEGPFPEDSPQVGGARLA